MLFSVKGSDGETWTAVEVNGQQGYIKSKYLAVPAQESESSGQESETNGQERKELNYAGVTTARNVYLRKTPDDAGEKLAILGKDEQVYMLFSVKGSDGETWTAVEVGGQQGYIKSKYLIVKEQ